MVHRLLFAPLALLAGAGVSSCSGGGDSSQAATTGAVFSSGQAVQGSSGATGMGGSSTGVGGSGSSALDDAGSSGAGSGAYSGAASGNGGSSGASGVSQGGVDSGGSGGSSGSSTPEGGVGASGAVVFDTSRVVVTGVRMTSSPPAAQTVHLHNGGPTPIAITGCSISGVDHALFQLNALPAFPTTLMPGADLPITVVLLTTGATLPAPLPEDSGSTLLTAQLTATTSMGSAQAKVYGLVLTKDIWEPTLGQILTTLGYALNVGLAQNNCNPNKGNPAQSLPGVETGTDEVAAPLFVKAGSVNVTMSVVARFSPRGLLPYGWYASTNASVRNAVGTMAMIADPQTSDKARMVLPPVAAGTSTSFDPGSAPFGLWVYSDQRTQNFAPAVASNGDYDYTQDALNSPPNVHRVKTYPLKDAAGARVPQHYLVAVEEATNGDYQDYVFILGNVSVAP